MNQANPHNSPTDTAPLPRGMVIALCLLTLIQIGWLGWSVPLYLPLIAQASIPAGPVLLMGLFNLGLVIGVFLLCLGKRPHFLLFGSGGAMLLLSLFGDPLPLTFAARGFNWLGAGIGLLGGYLAGKQA